MRTSVIYTYYTFLHKGSSISDIKVPRTERAFLIKRICPAIGKCPLNIIYKHKSHNNSNSMVYNDVRGAIYLMIKYRVGLFRRLWLDIKELFK